MCGWGITACVCLLLVLSVFPVAEAYSSTGKVFFLGFMDNRATGRHADHVVLEISTTSPQDIRVEITTPLYDPLLNKEVFVNLNKPQTVKLPKELRGWVTELSTKGVYVKADDYITVFGVNVQGFGVDMYLGIPLPDLGTEYRAVTNLHLPEVLVIGTEDNTTVTIAFPSRPAYFGKLGRYFRRKVLSIVIHKFETLHVQGSWGQDFTGAHITADKPVSAYSGNRGYFYSYYNKLDYTEEMLLPVHLWGTVYNTAHLPPRSKGDLFKILASQDNTAILLGDGEKHVLPKADKCFPKKITDSVHLTIVCDKPCMVSVLSQSSSFYNAALAQLVPPNRYRPDYTWKTPTNFKGRFYNFMSIVINKQVYDGLRLDGLPLKPSFVENITESHNVHLTVNVAPGGHYLKHENPVISFFALFSGKQPISSYAAPGGYGSETKYVCEIFGDPHARTFSGQEFSLAMPCTYVVTRLRVTNFVYKPGVTYYPEIVLEVHASNNRRTINGRYYVTSVAATVTLWKNDSPGPYNTYYLGERLIKSRTFWKATSNETLQDRVRYSYDPATRLGTFEVTHTSLKLEFRLPRRRQGNSQKVTPGLSVTVNTSDLIYDRTIQFPNTICSTIDDTYSVYKTMTDYKLEEKYIGMYAMMKHDQFPFPDGKQDRRCPRLKTAFRRCRKSPARSTKKCLRLMRSPDINKCFNKGGVSVTVVTEECLKVFCSRRTPNCTKLLEYVKSCPPIRNLLRNKCPR